jgi:hypothetical protein
MASGFPLRWQAFRLAKQGNAAADYEDAAAGDGVRGRFAVADGASEASFAAIWARLLVERFVNDPGKPWHDLDWVDPLRREWSTAVDGLPLPWYAEEKRELGAFATFLGLAFRPSAVGPNGYWRAVAVGDCGLFHTRGGRVLCSFPMTNSTDFSNRPMLLRSRPGQSVRRELAHGRWKSQDRFLLMTDALAQWFLARSERGGDPLAEISDLLTESTSFADWVADRRKQAGLRNDDVTLIVVDVE